MIYIQTYGIPMNISYKLCNSPHAFFMHKFLKTFCMRIGGPQYLHIMPPTSTA